MIALSPDMCIIKVNVPLLIEREQDCKNDACSRLNENKSMVLLTGFFMEAVSIERLLHNEHTGNNNPAIFTA
jgi:hypothetical protein